MAGGPSTYQSDRTLAKSLKGTDYTPPATMYMALFTTSSETSLRANTVAGASECPNSGSYARVAVPQASFATPTGGTTSITGDVVFPTATGSWGNCLQGALMDSATHGAGNVLYFGPLSAAANIQNGDSFKVPSGTFVVNA